MKQLIQPIAVILIFFSLLCVVLFLLDRSFDLADFHHSATYDDLVSAAIDVCVEDKDPRIKLLPIAPCDTYGSDEVSWRSSQRDAFNEILLSRRHVCESCTARYTALFSHYAPEDQPADTEISFAYPLFNETYDKSVIAIYVFDAHSSVLYFVAAVYEDGTWKVVEKNLIGYS